MNQHFLFNSLNSLSSLIQDDEEKAEKFLDEMSKVYRYLLHNDDEQLVTLGRELKFIQSYRHLLKARYGNGLELDISVDENVLDKWLPPLTLQVIIENAFTNNSVSKDSPLKIAINSQDDNIIKVSNNIQPKIIAAAIDNNSAIENVVNKYGLLANLGVRIVETDEQREIYLPLLFNEKEEALL